MGLAEKDKSTSEEERAKIGESAIKREQLATRSECTSKTERATALESIKSDERAKITESTVRREQLATLSENTTERERARPLEGTT